MMKSERKLLSMLIAVAMLVTGIFVSGSAQYIKNTAYAADGPSVLYKVQVQKKGWESSYKKDGATSGTVGQALRLEAIKIKLANMGDYEGGIEYKTHIQSIGWESDFVSDDAVSGTVGRSLRLEAIQIQLYGEIRDYYDVYYRVQAQKFGWLGWAKNGESAGTAGYGFRLEGIQIVLAAKDEDGNSKAPTTSDGVATVAGIKAFYNKNAAPTVSYKTQVQTYGWQNYVTSRATSGTVGKAKRLEGIKIYISNKKGYTGGISYRTHVQKQGWQDWVSDNALSGTVGRALRLEAIRIKLTGDMVKYFDVYYRVQAQKFGWMGWTKNGASAGTSGYGYRLEAIQIQMVEKGTPAGVIGSTKNSYTDEGGKPDTAVTTDDEQEEETTPAEEETTTKKEEETTTKKEEETTTKKEEETTTKKEEETTTKKEEETTTAEEETTKYTGEITYTEKQEPTDEAGIAEEKVYDELFDINNKVTVDIDISDEQLKLMEADYKAGDEETYRMADVKFTIDGTSYDLEEVGVRLKGNTSRVDIYNNGNVKDRNAIHLKLSFQETFDDEGIDGYDTGKWDGKSAARKVRKNRTFATLKALELKWNRNVDPTYMANVYANMMYRDLGVYAQNTSLANVHFGGYNYGVYTMYEPIDNIFCKRYLNEVYDDGSFNKADGDLYKCKWGQLYGDSDGWSGATYKKSTQYSAWVEEEGMDYIYTLKTNKKKSEHEDILNFINTMDNSSVTKEKIEGVLETDLWVKFAALSYFVGNPDDMRNNYNNHYVYFSSQGKAIFMPYDNDRCLGLTTSKLNMASYSPRDDQARLQGNTQQSPVYLYTVTGRDNKYTTEYMDALKEVYNSGWLEYDNFKKYYNIAKENYEDVAIPDSHVTLKKQDLGEGSPTYYNSSDMAFGESNSVVTSNGNQTVESYLSAIKSKYETAMNK